MATNQSGKIDIAEQVQAVIKKLTSDSGLLEKFKSDAFAVVQKLLPAIKDQDILNKIAEAVKAKLNVNDLLGSVTGGLSNLLGKK